MPEQSAIAYQEGRKAFVAGISWQPISQSGYSKRTAEIRELADRIDATRQIQLKTSYGVYVGLYNYDPDISDEERKGRMFSLAALLAKKVGTQNTILFWRIKEGYRKDEVALIVIEEGAPSLDFVASENEAMSTLQSYIDGSVNNTVYQLFTNAPDLLPNATLTDQTLLAGQFKNEYAFQALPTDFIKAGGIMTLVILAAGGLYYGNEYMIDQENKERLARAQAQVDTPRYLAALRSAQKAIGLPASEVQAMLNKLLDQPFVAKGWVLDTIVCQTGNCTSTWNSKGGYTEELIGFLYNQTPVHNARAFNTISFTFDYHHAAQGVVNLNNLAMKADMQRFLYNEQQAWAKAGFTNTVNANGEQWPVGFRNVPESQAVNRYPVSITGSLPIVRDFLSRYSTDIFWNTIELKIDADSAEKPLEIKLQGAFYAY